MRAIGIVVVLAFIALASWAGPVDASITVSVDQGVLSVIGDDEPDTIGVECADGQVIVSGNPPGTGAAACDSITSIVVTSGGGADEIWLDRVGPATYPSVSSVGIDAGEGPDTVTASAFVDTIIAGPGRDGPIIADPTSGDVLDGGLGRDTAVWRFVGELTVTDTTVMTSSGSVPFTGFEFIRLRGGPGGDRLDASAFSGLVGVDGGKGNDRLLVGGSPTRFFNEVEGGAGHDVLIGGSGQDALDGRVGDDEIFGRGGPDSLEGGAGDDRIFAGAGNDNIYMVRGSDVTSGGAGRDHFQLLLPARGVIRGGPSVDTAHSYFGPELVLGRRSVESRRGRLFLRSVDILLLIATRFEPSRLDGRRYRGDLHVSVEAVYPFYGNESLTALGGWGDDILSGGPGDDVLSGGPGRDELDGQHGTDDCSGGPGRDRIVDCE